MTPSEPGPPVDAPVDLDPHEQRLVSDFLGSAARRASWLLRLMLSSVTLAIIVGIAGVAGINARSDGAPAIALIAGFGLACAGMVASFSGYVVHHVRMHRAMRALEGSKLLEKIRGA